MRDASLNPTFSVSRLAVHLTLWGACTPYLTPLLVMLLTSSKVPDGVRTGSLPPLPDTFTVIGWFKAWDSIDALFWNSVLITALGMLIPILTGVLNGYVLSMWRFRGSQLFFGAPLFGCFLPFQVILLSMSFTLGKLGLADTTSGLVLVYVIYGLAFTTLFFRNYFVTIPGTLVKATRLDGAGLSTISLCILPSTSAPIVMVYLVWQSTQVWSDLLFSVMFASGDSQPITMAPNNPVNIITGVKEYNVDMTVTMIATLPTLMVYVLAGKYFVRGLTAGTAKD